MPEWLAAFIALMTVIFGAMAVTMMVMIGREPEATATPKKKKKHFPSRVWDWICSHNWEPSIFLVIFSACAYIMRDAIKNHDMWPQVFLIMGFIVFLQLSIWICNGLSKNEALETPSSTVEHPEETPKQKRDRLLNESWNAIWTIKEINERIPDQHFSEQVDAIEMLSRQILEQASVNEGKLALARQFLTSYLPMTRQLLETYDRVYSMAAPGPNVEQTKKKIESALDTVILAFKQQADQLCMVDLTEATTDVSALLTSMACQGLGVEDPWEGTKHQEKESN